MSPSYNPVPKEEFYNRYRVLSDPFSISLTSYILEDEDPVEFFKDKNFFILNEETGKSLLHEAAYQDNVGFINFLKDIGHDINLLDKEYRTPLYDACSRLKLASVQALLDYDANPNLGNSHLVYKGNRYSDGTETLVTYQGETIPLVVTIDSVRMIAFERLENTLNQFTEGFSDLAIDNSAERTAALIVEELIKKGANVNLKTGPDDFSALHRAITYKYIPLIEAIINSDQAKPSLVDRDGETALHIVANYRQRIEKNFELSQMHKEKEIAELIIPYFNTLEIQEIKFGNTPLHSAVIRSNEFVVKLLYQKDYLFRHRKILSIQNKAGNTALHEAVNAAKQGPQILKLLLRVSTNDELAIVNKAGKTALQIAEDLLQESDQMELLIQGFKKSEKGLDKLIDSFQYHMVELAKNKEIFKWKPLTNDQIIKLKKMINDLNSAVKILENNRFFNEAIKDFELIDDMKILSFNLENYEQIVSGKKEDYYSNLINTADKFHIQALKLREAIDHNFLDKRYLESLISVRQEEYFSWKAKLLELPSSFPELINADSYLKDYRSNFNKASQFLSNAQTELTKANHSNAKKNVEEAIDLYQKLKNYKKLEEAYQILAKITINQGQQAIAHYEEINRNKALSSEHQEKLQGHLALAELYKEILERKRTSLFYLPDFDKVNELLARKSYYFYQAYKLTEGHLDNSAHVVLQRELGITYNAKLGTYNIQQCIAVIAFDPVSKKVVLSHFDKFSGPLSFIDQLLNEFPEHSKINLHLSGARDRVSLASSTSTISDNNIEQVLKQIFAEKKRFVIKSSDLGDKLSPEAIVFDIESERLIHAVPNFRDTSLESREVNFQLQWIKGDYLRPLNRVDFSESEAARKISFSIEQQQKIYERYRYYNKFPSQTEAWNHQIFYPLMTLYNEMEGITTSDYSDALLTASKLNVLPRIKQKNSDVAIVVDENPENRNVVIDIEGEETHRDLDPKQLPCLIMRRRRKRDPNCVLDSELLIDYLKSLSDSQHAEILDYLASRTIGGTKKEEVSRLIFNEKIRGHLRRVGQFSSRLTHVLLAKDAIGDLLKGDPTAAINLMGILGANHLLAQTSERIAEKGTRLLETGKILPGKLLRASAPFVARGSSLLLVGYDFSIQIKAIKNNSLDTDAWINAASDGIFLSMDTLEIGIEVAEFSSEAIAALGISSITTPVTATIGAIIILGLQIYESVKKVAHENELVHLTAWEKLKEGSRAFLGLEPEDSINKMMNEATEYKSLLEEKREFVKDFPEIKYFIFPAIEQVGKTCRKVTIPCSGSFHYMTVLVSKNCPTETVCTPKFNTILDNWICFKIKRTGLELKLTREIISPPSGTQLLCLPSAEEGIPPPPEIVYRCDAALGLNLTHNMEGKAALYDLGEGEDRVFGFDDAPNIFIINNGKKRYAGGYKDDIFIVKASKVISAFNPPDRFCPLSHLKGGLDGKGGVDTLSLKAFKPTAEKITIDLNKGFLKYDNSEETLAIRNIENLVCGEFPLSVIVGCDTQKIDIIGGSTLEKADAILIPENSTCYYETNFYLKPNSRLTNEASQGHFTYIIQSGTGIISVNVSNENSKKILSSWKYLSQHQFMFKADISDLFAISSTKQTITFHFSVNKVNRLYRAIQTISLIKSNESSLTLDYQFKPESFLDDDYLDLLPKLIAFNPDQKKLTSLFKNSVNNTVIVNDRAKIHEILFYFTKNSAFMPNDFKMELSFSLLNNFSFHFFDETEIKIVKGVNYLFYKGWQNINDIIAFYSPIARRLNMVCNIKTLHNQRVLIGHYGHQVMHNDRYAYETHIVSNEGQVLLVIQPFVPPILSTLNEVILHHTPSSRRTDILDFRQIKAKIQTKFRLTSAIELIILSRHNAHSFLLLASKENKKLENDLLLILAIKLVGNTFIDVITVRLKDALLYTWYRDHLHIILNVSLQQITGNVTNLFLQPIPLVFDASHEFISIGNKDVEENTKIILSRASYHAQFYQHNKTNLIYTNTLSTSNLIKPFSILLENFYNEPKLATLIFKFSNKEVILTGNSTALDAVENFESARKKQEEILNKESHAILASESIQQAQANKKAHEATTQSFTRQRRSILNPLNNTKEKNSICFFTKNSYHDKTFRYVSTIDSAQERADAYYDRYDRRKEKPRVNKASPKSRKNLTPDSVFIQDRENKQSASAAYESKKTINRLGMKKLLPILHKTKSPATTSQPTNYQPLNQVVIQKDVRFYQNNLSKKQSQTQPIFKEIINPSEKYSRRAITQARLIGKQQTHQEWSSKTEGISRVTASSDLQSTLFTLNFIAKSFNKESNRLVNNPKIRRIRKFIDKSNRDNLNLR